MGYVFIVLCIACGVLDLAFEHRVWLEKKLSRLKKLFGIEEMR